MSSCKVSEKFLGLYPRHNVSIVNSMSQILGHLRCLGTLVIEF